jgi:hypothetical protein
MTGPNNSVMLMLAPFLSDHHTAGFSHFISEPIARDSYIIIIPRA